MTIQHIQKLMIYTEPNKKIVMKKKYEKPTFDVIEMDKELLGLVTGSNGESEAWSKKNNNLFEMDSDKESDEEDEHGTNYNLWSE